MIAGEQPDAMGPLMTSVSLVRCIQIARKMEHKALEEAAMAVGWRPDEKGLAASTCIIAHMTASPSGTVVIVCCIIRHLHHRVVLFLAPFDRASLFVQEEGLGMQRRTS